ncbi:hypothetical protein [Vibrio harveyi]|uniref:hypothetical protein n=1 Tax=Vibrio harveyi TaxID=669 RepID=UPI004063C51B
MSTKSVFEAQTENVRELEKVWKNSIQLINEAYRNDPSDKQRVASYHTRMLALIFASYAEVSFSKLINTPHGLSHENREQIRNIAKRNTYQGWLKCLECVVELIDNDDAYKAQVRTTITQIIDDYIKEPSEIRNKIAHGQWVSALNSRNTSYIKETSDKIENLTCVDLIKYKISLTSLCSIIEDLIESPNKAHKKFYRRDIKKYLEKQSDMATWTLESKLSKLKPKRKPNNT